MTNDHFGCWFVFWLSVFYLLLQYKIESSHKLWSVNWLRTRCRAMDKHFVSSTVLTSGFLLIVTDSFISNQKWEWTSIERGKGGQKIKYNFAQGLILWIISCFRVIAAQIYINVCYGYYEVLPIFLSF